MKHVAGVLLVVMVSALLMAGNSLAATNVGSFYPRDDGVAFAFVASAQADMVEVNVSGDPWSLIDPAGVFVYSDCEVAEPGHASCVKRDGKYFGQTRAGDDRVSIIGRMPGRIGLGSGNDAFADGTGASESTGGLGRDRMNAGSGDDSIRGGPGRDKLRGGAGRDWLDGEKGRDGLKGGAGPDRVLAVDDRRDRVIDCGPGDDRPVIDAGLDPRPRHCEEVRKR